MSENMTALLAELERAADEFGADRLAGAMQSFRAVLGFLEAEGVEARRLLPLVWLASSMNDAFSDAGQKPFHDAHTWAFAAAAVDLLKQSGVEIAEGARLVARAANREFDAKQLIEFRKNIRKGRVRDEAADAYHWCVSQQGPRLNNLSEAARRKAVLHMVRTLFGK